MTDYTEFFLNTPADIVMLETIRVSHPNLSKTYSFVKNKTDNLSAKIETGSTIFFEYLPMSISRGQVAENIDQQITVTFGDLGEIFPQELDRITNSGGFITKPTLTYRAFRSDNLNSPMEILRLKVENIEFNSDGCIVTARSKFLNLNSVGERYTMDRFPMLRGLL